MPIRIQRKRSKGWRLPENTVCVTRPGKWGNPFTVMPNARPGAIVGGAAGYRAVPTLQNALECYREYLCAKPEIIETARVELAGKDLACFCPLNQPCHADILLEIANSEEQR